MTNQNLNEAVDVLVHLHRILNSYEVITIDNKDLWKKTLHRMDNSIWLTILEVLDKLHSEHPELFKPFNVEAFEKAETAFNKYGHMHERLLDTKQYKGTAWRCLMSIREVMEAARKSG